MSNVSTTRTPATIERYSSQRVLGLLAVMVGGLGLVKFLGLMVGLGPARAPWGFLLVLVVPFVVGRMLLPSRPRVAAAVIGLFSAVFGALSIAVIVQRSIEPYWGDYLLVFVGGPLALAAVAVAVRVLRGR